MSADTARAIGLRRHIGRILAGGQSGVDRAALDVALAYGIVCGGWCPQGRLAEDGPIAARYPLRETPDADPAVRTRRNVEEADALLVLHLGQPDGGTALAIGHAVALGKPTFVADLACEADIEQVGDWLAGLPADAAVNIAGPRESNAPGVYLRSADALRRLLAFDDQLDLLAGP